MNLIRISIRQQRYVLFIATALFIGQHACQAQQAVYELGNVEVDDESYSIDVVMEFRGAEETPEPSPVAVFFSLDVSDSDELLAPNGDYGAFSFDLDPSLGEWNQIPNTGFSSNVSAIEFETISQPLPAGKHTLGSLKFNANQLSHVLPASVAITAGGTAVGLELPNDPPSFDFIDIEFSPGVVTIPEPTGNWPVLLAIFGAIVAFRKNAR